MKKNKLFAVLCLSLSFVSLSVFAKSNNDSSESLDNADVNQQAVGENKDISYNNNKDLTKHSLKNNGIVYSDPQKPIVVKKNAPTFSIILQSNPSTGYSWSLKSLDSEIIKPISKNYYAGKTGLIGAPGYEKWTFAVKPYGFVVPETTNVTLIYARPWDLQGAQAINFKVVTTNVN